MPLQPRQQDAQMPAPVRGRLQCGVLQGQALRLQVLLGATQCPRHPGGDHDERTRGGGLHGLRGSDPLQERCVPARAWQGTGRSCHPHPGLGRVGQGGGALLADCKLVERRLGRQGILPHSAWRGSLRHRERDRRRSAQAGLALA